MTKHELQVRHDAYKVLFIGLLVGMTCGAIKHQTQVQAEDLVWPVNKDAIVVTQEIKVDKPDENQDAWIREAAHQFANRQYPESYLKYQLHCLANKESGHHGTNNCGDGGKSCGMYQYRTGTWEGFRKIMMKQGLATEIGSLWDDKLAIFTTAWALSDGRHQNWGPWLRGACR